MSCSTRTYDFTAVSKRLRFFLTPAGIRFTNAPRRAFLYVSFQWEKVLGMFKSICKVIYCCGQACLVSFGAISLVALLLA